VFARSAAVPGRTCHTSAAEGWTFGAPFSMMQLRLMPRRRSGIDWTAMESMMLHGCELVRPTRMVSSGVRVSLDLGIEIVATVVAAA
jgi:hypothetical protein